jgi:predicted permease
MENLLYLVILLALGKISRSLSAFDENTPDVLNRFVIYFSLPATILLKINGIHIEPDLWVLAFIPWLLIFLTILMVYAISKFLHWEKKLTGAVLLAVGLGNTSFFGFPAIAAFFGEDSLGYAIIYDQLGTFLAFSIFGSIVVSIYGTSQEVSLKTIILKILKFPPFIALVVAFLMMKIPFPSVVTDVLEGLSATLIPLVIFSVGAQLKFRQPVSNIKPICIMIFLKMIVSPLLVFFLLLTVGVKGHVLNISVFEAAMPTMILSGVIAAAGGLKADVVHAAIGYGIIFSFLTLPAFYYLLTTL